MTKMIRLFIAPTMTIDDAWTQLEEAGFSVAYSEEEVEQILHLFDTDNHTFASWTWIIKCEKYSLPAIDWEAQWEAHGMDFKEGKVHLNLAQFGDYTGTLKLQPGPGFGDLSHPTTRLMLKLMPHYLTDQLVIDIGCGSGVLSCAAAAMGASFVYGVDIDFQALEHSQKNAELNGLQSHCNFTLPENFSLEVKKTSPLILINMIASEQQIAWPSLPQLATISAKILTSGIRIEKKKKYLEQTQVYGWHLLQEAEEEGWMAFCFEQKTNGLL